MKPKVYIETSIPSFYYEVRTEPGMVARRDWTRQWWENSSREYYLVTSAVVLEEVGDGEYPNKGEIVELAQSLPIVPVEPAIHEIVETYVRHQVMPARPLGDALHLALASHHKCDFLLTWNCRHLANANKFGQIRRVNSMLGLYIPMLVTPLELLGGLGDEEG